MNISPIQKYNTFTKAYKGHNIQKIKDWKIKFEHEPNTKIKYIYQCIQGQTIQKIKEFNNNIQNYANTKIK